MHAAIANYHGNPNMGLFCYANDRYCLVPPDLNETLKKKFEEVLKVPVYEIRAAGTSLLGVFFAGNDDILLVPEIMFESEIKELEKHKIKYKIINSELTALGNNLLIKDKMCIASPDYSDAVIMELEEAGFTVKKGKIAGLSIVGSLAVTNDKGCLASPDIEKFEKTFLEKSFRLPVATGSVNFGSPYVSSGIVCNSHGFVIGDMSGGPEIQNADIALGFIEG